MKQNQQVTSQPKLLGQEIQPTCKFWLILLGLNSSKHRGGGINTLVNKVIFEVDRSAFFSQF